MRSKLRTKLLDAARHVVLILILVSASFSPVVLYAQTPVDANGELQVVGTELRNENGDPVQLRGMSTHGPQWYASCINFDAINTMTNDWGIDVLRLAMYVEEEGYVTDPEYWKSWIDDMVALTGQFGIYCIIDWHVHQPGDPWANIEEARDFWDHMSSTHAGKEHVIYEICNEPNGVDWARVKSYAEEIIPIIRANDPNSIIIVGTPTYSQDVDIAAQDPLSYDNIMYTLHFYSGTHGQFLRQKAETAMNAGLAIMATEWGTSQATGDGGPYLTEADTWVTWMADNNISWCNWSYADKDEISAALVPGSCLSGQWNNTSQSGAYIKDKLLVPDDSWAGTGGNINPVGNIVSPADGLIFESGDEVNISATASDADGSVSLVEFYANGNKIGEDNTAPYSYNWTTSALGDFDLTVVVTDNQGATGTSSPVSISVVDEIIQYAYPDEVPHTIPGEIEGVHFDVGGEGIAYHDADAVHKGAGIRQDEGVDTENSEGAGNIGYVVNDEWLEYTVNVENTGTYDIDLRVASLSGGGQFHLEFDGEDVTGPVTVGSTGAWSSYQTLTISDVALTSGEQVMRMYVDVGDFNFAQFSFTLTGSDVVPPTAVAAATPTNGLAPLTVIFDGTGSNDADGTIDNYSWDFGDGTTSSGENASHIYNTAGTYEAVLTVTDDDGETDTDVITITVTEEGENTAPVASINGTPASGTVPLTVNFDASGSSDVDGDNLSYSWDFGDGTTGSGEIVSHTYSNSGTYTATVTVSDGELIDDASTGITVSPEDEGGCETDTPISLPFTQDGVGEFCWVTSGDINYINSWNADLIEVNGVEFTNQYAGTSDLPARIDGNYYIHYVASVGWAHFEIDGSNDGTVVQYTLNTTTTGSGNISLNPTGSVYDAGTEVTITANASAGWQFKSWSGDLSGSTNPVTIVMNEDQSVTANFSEVETLQFTLTTSVNGAGSITLDPLASGGTYDEGTVVVVSAVAEAGWLFDGWSGDLSGTTNPQSITMDANHSVVADFTEQTNSEICESPVSISTPFVQESEGEYCFVTSDDIAYINSWNMDALEINGVDYTNAWSDQLPAKVDGNYYIYYNASVSWAHFEASDTKSASFAKQDETKIQAYPNPFKETVTLDIDHPEDIKQMVVIDQTGRKVLSFDNKQVQHSMEIGSELGNGLFFIKLITIHGKTQTLMIHKQLN